LKTAYPLITEGSHDLWKAQQYQTTSKDISKPSSKIDDDETEVAYLKEIELFMTETHTKEITKIKNKLAFIEKTQRFDCSKILLLPEDMIGEIKSYLEPELKFTRRFFIIRHLDMGGINLGWKDVSWLNVSWMDVDRWLVNVPKKIVMNVITGCGIYPTGVKSGDKKDEWCKFIHHQFHNLFSKEKSAIRIDKLMEQHKYIYDNSELIIDKWFKIVLYIYCFNNYRRLLERKLKKTDDKIRILKNRNIVINKNI
jgi:hypothetical protein